LNKTFFIPNVISQCEISRMQISPDLRYVCKRLNLRKMADLGAITENDLRKVLKKLLK